MKRIKYSQEPTLHVHRYIVRIGKVWNKTGFQWKYRYCLNLKEVREQMKTYEKKCCVIEVFSANHNFREAWASELTKAKRK